MQGNRISIFESPPDPMPGDRNQEQQLQRHGVVSSDSCKPSPSSSSSSSIGKNSDISGRLTSDGDDSGDTTTEVQSTYKGGPLDGMEALEEVLPVRRGISRFYNGKSKSFASLAYASSIQDLAKPENAYTRKRRNNLLASTLSWDKNHHRSCAAGGISKRLTNLNRTKMALAVAMTTTTTTTTTSHDFNLKNNLITSTTTSSPCPLQAHNHPRDFSASWRSFSFADFLQCASVHNVATTHTFGSSSSSSSSTDEAPTPS